MISYPNAKINLGLNVVQRRPDGFHDIESVFYPVPWRDILEIVPAKEGRGEVAFTSSGLEIPSDGNPNLCEQVYSLMHDEFGLSGVKMHLHKIVPIGAGLGGGSADAAFTAIMLNKLFELKLSADKLEQIVGQVGSDCPFFWENKPMFVFGRGEKMRPIDLDLSDYHVLIVNPNIHISTKEAYAGVQPSPPVIDLEMLPSIEVDGWKDILVNDFETSIFPNYPLIKEIKDELYNLGALYASMTGSGSTLFGIFKEVPEEEVFRSYMTWKGRLTF